MFSKTWSGFIHTRTSIYNTNKTQAAKSDPGPFSCEAAVLHTVLTLHFGDLLLYFGDFLVCPGSLLSLHCQYILSMYVFIFTILAEHS